MTNTEVEVGVGQLLEVQRGTRGLRRVENLIHNHVHGQDQGHERGPDHNQGTSGVKRHTENLEEVATPDHPLRHLEERGMYRSYQNSRTTFFSCKLRI